jgi:hypothetical protein
MYGKMEHKRLNLIIAGGVFLISFIVLFLTTQSSVPFWDCSESSAAASLLQVPHPPGAPFHTLLGRIFMMIPFFELGFRMNLLSTLTGALTIALTYLSCVILILKWRGIPKNITDKLLMYGSSAIGALSLSFSDTFWFNAVESEVYAPSLFLLALIVWLALHWSTVSETTERSEKYFLLILYLFGLSVGVHQLSLLAFFSVALIYYFEKYEFTIKSFAIFCGISIAAFLFIYKGILTGLPVLLSGSGGEVVFFILIALILYGIYYSYKNYNGILNFALLAIVMIILGYSTYSIIVIRAGKGLALNQNNPDSFGKLSSYIGREQYGDWPIINFDKTKYDGKLFPRRWTDESYRKERFKNYKSDMDYFIRYQFYNMWFRYLLFNFAGRAGDIQDSPPALFGKADEKWIIGREGAFPNRYFAIPFIIGLLGAVYHLLKDKKLGSVIWVLFIITGFGLMVYQNMQDPQPRERDYFFVGSFYVFAIWIGLGMAAIFELLEKKISFINNNKNVFAGILCIGAIAIPGNMLYQNYYDHNRHNNYLAWDFAYNMLQSCPKDAILFTNGDNDTFPVWYLQDAEGIRRDVRLVNLSLVNMSWYALQLKNDTPYGAKKVPISLTDQEIDQNNRKFHEWEKSKVVNIPVPKKVFKRFLNEELKNQGEFKSLLSYSMEHYDDTSKYPANISFNVKSYYALSDRSGKTHHGIRTQDVMIMDIIRTNNWERPICFAISNTTDTRIGLDTYLRNEGLVYRLTPFNLNTRYEYINPKLVYDQLMNEPEEYSKEYKPGLKFRQLNNPGLYLDEPAMRLAQNYRTIFMSLAAYFISYPQDYAKAYEVLKLMEKKLPESTIYFDYRMKYNLLQYYHTLNKKEDFDKLFTSTEKDCLLEIEKDPDNTRNQWNPYNLLIELYQSTGNYDKEMEILNKLKVIYPQNAGLQNRIDEVNRLKNPPKEILKTDSNNNKE